MFSNDERSWSGHNADRQIRKNFRHLTKLLDFQPSNKWLFYLYISWKPNSAVLIWNWVQIDSQNYFTREFKWEHVHHKHKLVNNHLGR